MPGFNQPFDRLSFLTQQRTVQLFPVPSGDRHLVTFREGARPLQGDKIDTSNSRLLVYTRQPRECSWISLRLRT